MDSWEERLKKWFDEEREYRADKSRFIKILKSQLNGRVDYYSFSSCIVSCVDLFVGTIDGIWLTIYFPDPNLNNRFG
jgi:hypothetical protein